MDTAKRNQLIARLEGAEEPQIVSIEEFFDGNDDPGSIGCNLLDHPGIDAFRNAFALVARRPDVEAVYAEIKELDPGDGCWPFADTVYVVGSIPPELLASELADLEPDELGPAGSTGVPETIARRHSLPVLVAWWD